MGFAAAQQKCTTFDFVLGLNTSIQSVLRQHSAAPVLRSLEMKNKLRWKIQASDVICYFGRWGRERKLWEML